MPRLTKKLNNEIYIVDDSVISRSEDGYFGEAVKKLAIFENVLEEIASSQIEISKELEKLRNEGKTNSYKFRELMGKKLMNSNIIATFKGYGLQ